MLTLVLLSIGTSFVVIGGGRIMHENILCAVGVSKERALVLEKANTIAEGI